MKNLEIVSKGALHQIIVDDDDYDRVTSVGSWHISHGKGPSYVRRRVIRDGRKMEEGLHNFIIGSIGVDHINRDTFDNRKSNLRLATQAQNNQNVSLSKNNTSGYRGVSWHARDKKWLARVQVNGKLIHIGRFDDREIAAMKVRAARIKLLPYSNEEMT